MVFNWLKDLTKRKTDEYVEERKATIPQTEYDLTEIKGIANVIKQKMNDVGILWIHHLAVGGNDVITKLKGQGIKENRIALFISRAKIYLEDKAIRSGSRTDL